MEVYLVDYRQGFNGYSEYLRQPIDLLKFTVFYRFIIMVINTIIIRKVDSSSTETFGASRFIYPSDDPIIGLLLKDPLYLCIMVKRHKTIIEGSPRPTNSFCNLRTEPTSTRNIMFWLNTNFADRNLPLCQ